MFEDVVVKIHEYVSVYVNVSVLEYIQVYECVNM